MSKVKTTFILALLLTTVFAPILLNIMIPVANASTGWIRVRYPNVKAGGTVLLNFTEVTWSGTQFLLYWSTDGYSQISSSDQKMIITPISVSLFDKTYPYEVKVKANSSFYTTDTITIKIGTNSEHQKVLEIPIPEKNTAGGAHFIKAFDGMAAQVAVSEEINVLPALKLSPSKGPGGCLVTLEGVALLPNELVNITYTKIDKAFAQETTDEIGYFKYSWNIKDLGTEWSGVGPIPANDIDVSVYYNATEELVDTVIFTEYARALYRVYDQISNYPDEGFGNKTVTVGVPIMKEVVVSGNGFNPTDNVTLYLDVRGLNKFLVQGPVNATGFFNVTFTVPDVPTGTYEVAILNAGYAWVFDLEVMPSIVLVPSEGKVGTPVTVYGYGFPYITNKFVNVTITWEGYETIDVAWAKVESNGRFTTQFKVPHDYGGEHTVTATANDTAQTSASATFTVLPDLKIVPDKFANDGSLVTVYGTGLDPNKGYTPNIDNRLLGVDPNSWDYPSSIYCNETGDIELKFVAAGFTPGLHVFSLYAGGELKPTYVTFTVIGVSPDTQAILNQLATNQADLLAQLKSLNANITDLVTNSKGEVLAVISTTKGEILAKLDDLNAKLVSINGTVATIQTSLGMVTVKIDENTAKILDKLAANQADLLAQLKSLSDKIATLSNSVDSVKTTLTAGVQGIRSDIAGVKSDLATLSDSMSKGFSGVNSAIGTLSSSVDSMGKSLSSQITGLGNTLSKSISDNANSIQTSIKNAQDAVSSQVKSSVGDLSTFLIIIGILAAITLVIEAAILIRRLS